MGKFLWVAIGAGLMYFMDPEHGSERQSTWKQKLDKYMNKGGDMFGSAGMGGSTSGDFGTGSSYGSSTSGMGTTGSAGTTGTTGTSTFGSQRAA